MSADETIKKLKSRLRRHGHQGLCIEEVEALLDIAEAAQRYKREGPLSYTLPIDYIEQIDAAFSKLESPK